MLRRNTRAVVEVGQMLALLGWGLLLALLLVIWMAVKILEATGLRKRERVPPSGVPVGGRALRTFKRDSSISDWYYKAWDEKTVVTDAAGESWRVEGWDEAIDNTYKFTIRRVA